MTQPRGIVGPSTSNGATTWSGEWPPLNRETAKSLRSSSGSTATTKPRTLPELPEKNYSPSSEKRQTGEAASDVTSWGRWSRQSRFFRRLARRSGGLSRLSSMCILAMLDMPKPRAAAWLVASMFLGAAVPLGIFAWHLWPQPSPIQILENRSYWNEDGHWVVETDARTEDVCTLVVSRQFVPASGAGATVSLAPIGTDLLSGRMMQPGSMPYAFQTTVQSGTVRYVYDIEPGEFSQHLIEINAFRCARGFEGAVGRWAVGVGMP